MLYENFKRMSEIIYKYLDDRQKQQLIDECLEKLPINPGEVEQNKGSISVLKNILLLDIVFSSYQGYLLLNLEQYCCKILESKHLDIIDTVTEFTEINENLKTRVFDYVFKNLMAFLTSTTLLPLEILELNDFINFSKEYRSSTELIPSKDDGQFYLKFLIKLNYREFNEALNKFLCFSLTLNDLELPKIIYEIIDFNNFSLDNSLKEIVWTVIFELTLRKDRLINNEQLGYKLWINYLYMIKKNHVEYDFFLKMVESSQAYWVILQRILVSDNYEFRKYAISIIQLTFQNIPKGFNFKNGTIMNWNSEFEKDWNRFFTIYEITGIDTSLHQVQEGLKDFHLLKSIPKSWLVILLSTSIKSSMDSVRKFALEFILKMDDAQLALFSDSVEFLNIFFDFVMQANLFHVSSNGKCLHGEKLSNFVQTLLRKLIDDKEYPAVQNICDLIFTKLASSPFEFAKVYLVLGLNNGLNKNLLHQTSLFKLEHLFNKEMENTITKMVLSRTYFKLLMKIDFKRVVLKTVITSIAKFVSINGYSIIAEECEALLDFISVHYSKDELLFILTNTAFNNYPLETYIVTLFMLYNFKYDLKSLEISILKQENFPKIMLEIVKSNLNFSNLIIQIQNYYLKLTEELSNNLIKDANIWKYAYVLINDSIFHDDDENILNTCINFEKMKVVLNVEFQSSDSKISELCVSKLRFFCQCYAKTKYLYELNFNDILKLNNSILKTIDTIDYRDRDMCYQNIFQLIYQCLQVSLITDDVIKSLFNFIRESLKYSLYNSKLEILNIFKFLLDNPLYDVQNDEILEITKVTLEMWTVLREQRLKLNESKLHVLLIDTLFNKKILELCTNDKEVRDLIMDTANDIIEQAFARRSLLPQLAYKLAEFQLSNEELFSSEKCMFMSALLVNLSICSRISSSSFKLVEVICDKYDKDLNYGSTDVYFDIYGPKEVTYKIKTIAMIAALKPSSPVCYRVVEYILTNEQLHLFQPLKKVSGEEEANRLQLYSLILLSTKILRKEKLQSLFGDKLTDALNQEQSPKVRVYIEWLICLTCTEESKEKFFNIIKYTNVQAELSPSIIISYIRICYLLRLYENLVPVLISYSASGKVLIRHFAASLICSLYELDLLITNEERNILKCIVNSVTQFAKVSEFRIGDANTWDIQNDLSLTGIFGGVLYKLSNEPLYLTSNDFDKYLTSKELSRIEININFGEDYEKLYFNYNQDAKFLDKAISEISTDEIALQKKSGYWKNMIDKEETQIKRSELIVMGSLVNKPPNLGGICRLCDVLGAGLLTIGADDYKKLPHFKSVAVTADKWLPMLEVKPDKIIEYLQRMKDEGYTLIGLEQTDQSVQLNYDLKFPKKSLIVLGKEKEGIPGNILAQLDLCVEIKQVGVIRLMNIQTATALIVHAYSLQYC